MTGHWSGQLWRAVISATTKLASLWGKGKAMRKLKEQDAENGLRPWWLKIPSGWIVFAVCLVGGIYVAYFVHLLAISRDCRSYSGLWFVQDCLAALPTNNIGDALGGAFAPLAFIFLAGALIIQAMELAAQRYEIDETQQVMRSQLEVAIQQVEETKASTELFKFQTEILRQEQKAREAREADDAFQQMTNTLWHKIREHSNLLFVWVKFTNVGSSSHQVGELVKFADMPNLHQASSFLLRWSCKVTASLPTDAQFTVDPHSINLVREIDELLKAMCTHLQNMSFAGQQMATGAGLKKTANSITSLRNICESHKGPA
ncbi:hypothetical protein ACQZ4X_17235 [Agrobacterium vitis]